MDHVDGGADHARRAAHANAHAGPAHLAQRLADADAKGHGHGDVNGNTVAAGNACANSDATADLTTNGHTFAVHALAYVYAGQQQETLWPALWRSALCAAVCRRCSAVAA